MSNRLTDEQVADQAEWWAAGLIPGAPLPHPLLLAREVQEWRRTVLGIDPDTVLTRTCETCGGMGATSALTDMPDFICPDCDNGTVEVNRIMVGPPCTCGDRFADYVCHSAYKPCYHPTDIPDDATVIGPDDARALRIGRAVLASAPAPDAFGNSKWISGWIAGHNEARRRFLAAGEVTP